MTRALLASRLASAACITALWASLAGAVWFSAIVQVDMIVLALMNVATAAIFLGETLETARRWSDNESKASATMFKPPGYLRQWEVL